MDIEEVAIIIRDAVRDYPNLYEKNLKELKRKEEELIDINHLIEFIDFNAHEGFMVYKEKQKVLRERRKLKDEIALLEPLYPILKSYKGRWGQLDKAVASISKAKKNFTKRKCRCRVRKDLQDKINGVKKS